MPQGTGRTMGRCVSRPRICHTRYAVDIIHQMAIHSLHTSDEPSLPRQLAKGADRGGRMKGCLPHADTRQERPGITRDTCWRESYPTPQDEPYHTVYLSVVYRISGFLCTQYRKVCIFFCYYLPLRKIISTFVPNYGYLCERFR